MVKIKTAIFLNIVLYYYKNDLCLANLLKELKLITTNSQMFVNRVIVMPSPDFAVDRINLLNDARHPPVFLSTKIHRQKFFI